MPSASTPSPHRGSSGAPHPSVLIAAGPTHEPVDDVRYFGNRSSGTLGISLAQAARDTGCQTTLLLGPSLIQADSKLVASQADQDPASHVHLVRFQTAKDLHGMLSRRASSCDVLIMAAAVADYRPKHRYSGKLPRTGQPRTIELEPVPDVLAATVPLLRPGAVAIGFALEERASELERAADKMARKGCHVMVLNPLRTMDSNDIDATILFAHGRPPHAPGPLTKDEFARRLVAIACDLWDSRQGATP